MENALFENDQGERDHDQVGFIKFTNPSEPYFDRWDKYRLLLRVVAILAVLFFITTMGLFVWNFFTPSDDLNLELNSTNSTNSTFGSSNVTSIPEYLKSNFNETSTPSSSSTLNTTSTTTLSPEDLELERRRNYIRGMTRDAWIAYYHSAWGNEALCPETQSSYEGNFGNNSGYTIVASMSSLWIMELHEEYAQARKWVQEKLDLKAIDRNLMLFDVVSNYVGGLLSCYAMSGEKELLVKAQNISEIVDGAFSAVSGIPYEDINPHTGIASDNQPYLSYMGGFQVEYNYLSDASSDLKFKNRIKKIVTLLKNIEKPKDLYLKMINTIGNWAGNRDATLFTLGRDFYTSLVKSFIQSSGQNREVLDMYKDAMDAIEKNKLIDISPKFAYYVRNFDTTRIKYDTSMEYSGCYLGAMFAMGANAMRQDLMRNHSIDANLKRAEEYRIYRHWQLAEKLTQTCKDVSHQTFTGLGPSHFYFNEGTHDETFAIPDHGDAYSLSPELAESYFVLWRLTHDEKYRTYAWDLAQSINAHCQTLHGGYSGILNVDTIIPEFSNYQEPHFLSATLKYLYLTFSDDEHMSLDEWVFNSQGHPLPICGSASYKGDKNCKFYA